MYNRVCVTRYGTLQSVTVALWSRWKRYGTLWNVSEPLQNVVERYGTLRGVAGRYGTLRERYGAVTEPLWKISIFPILIKFYILLITKMSAWLKWACRNRK